MSRKIKRVRVGQQHAPRPQKEAVLKAALAKARGAQTAESFADGVAEALHAIGAGGVAEITRVEARAIWRLIVRGHLTQGQALVTLARRAGDLQGLLLNALKRDAFSVVQRAAKRPAAGV